MVIRGITTTSWKQNKEKKRRAFGTNSQIKVFLNDGERQSGQGRGWGHSHGHGQVSKRNDTQNDAKNEDKNQQSSRGRGRGSRRVTIEI